MAANNQGYGRTRDILGVFYQQSTFTHITCLNMHKCGVFSLYYNHIDECVMESLGNLYHTILQTTSNKGYLLHCVY